MMHLAHGPDAMRVPTRSSHLWHRCSGRRGCLQVLCASDPVPKYSPSSSDVHSRAISVLKGAQTFDWRPLADRWKTLGGTLIVSDEENRGLIQQAAKEGTLSFGFSAGGLLFPFYVGVTAALQDAGLLTENTKLGGASAGSLIAACVKSGMGVDEITEHCLRLLHDVRTHGTRGRLGPVLETFLQDHLPQDAHERCAGRAYVAVTKATPYLHPLLVSDFRCREDLIRALMTSCHVPWYLDGTSLTEFRGDPHLDGGLTNFIPIVPGTVGVRVCCFPSKQLSPVYRIGISPDTFDPRWPYSMRQMVQWALEPAEDDFVQYFIEKGRRDAQAWMEAMGVGAVEMVEQPEGHVTAAKAAAAGSEDRQALEEHAKAQAAAGKA